MTYTPRILTETGDMDGIRYAAQMLPIQLTDEQILSAVLLPAVESSVISLIPSYASLTGNDHHLLRSATANLVAARAVSRTMDKERGMEYAYERKRSELVKELIDQANADLAEILGEDIWPTSLFITYGPTKRRKALGDWIAETVVLS